MTSEIFAFIQSNVQTQTAQNINTASNIENENSEAEQGLFESLITEFTEDTEFIDSQIQPELAAPEITQEFNFTGNNSFSQSVIDILAGMNTDKNEAENLSTEDKNTLQENFFAEVKDFFMQPVHEVISKIKNYVSEKLDSGDSEIENFIAELPEILNDENLNEKINLIPEDKKQEVIQAVNEFAEAFKNSDDDVKTAGLKLVNIIAENFSTPKSQSTNGENKSSVEDIKDDDTEKTSDEKINDITENTAGLAGVVIPAEISNLQPTSEQQPEISDERPQNNTAQNLQQPRNLRNASPEIKNTAPKTDSDSENVKADTKFNAVLESESTERENPESSNNNRNGQENYNDGRNNEQQSKNFSPSENNNSQRSRNDSRRISNEASRTQNDRNNSSASTNQMRRTEARNDFQAFFEGVLSSRRTFSPSSAQPLNLRTNYNFTQSETLRDGLVNVVRFIRADGVQRANVVIDPPALGRISVELTSGTSGVEASIKVVNEQIRQLVQDQLSELRMNLSQQGVQVAEFTVDVQQDMSQQRQGSQEENRRRRKFSIGEIDEEDINPEEFRVDLEEGLLYWVA